MIKAIFCLCLISVFSGFLVDQAETKDYVPAGTGEGYYSDVLQALEVRGDTILSKDDVSIMALYRFNKNIANLFEFSQGKLKSVTTNISNQLPSLALLSFDINCRRFGKPTEVRPLGKQWGDGFAVIFENDSERYQYSIRDIPLSREGLLQNQEIIWTQKTVRSRE